MPNFLRWQVLAWVVLWGFSPLVLQIGAAQENWQRLNSDAFEISYKPSDRGYLDQIVQLGRTAASNLSTRLNFSPTQRIAIFIADSQQTFDQLTGGAIPHWGEGVANARQNRIVIKSPNLTHSTARLSKLLTHELAHIYLGQFTQSGANLPRWFNEGMAVLLSSDEGFSGERLSKALISDSVIPIDEIEQMLTFPGGKAQLAYEQSYAFTLYLKEQFGFEALLQLARETTPDQPFDSIFEQVTGAEIGDIEQEWVDVAEDKYRWHFLLDFETYLWMFILLLVISGFVAIRLRNRRTMNRWEEEERIGL